LRPNVRQELLMRDISRRVVIGAVAALAALASHPTLAADATHSSGQRVALKGYDPVAYFTVGKPEQGSAEYQAAYDGVTYWFKNAEHRATFMANPDRYAPQFHAYCAINISRGEKYEADPEAWAIADGKLYVFGAKQGVAMFRQQAASIVKGAQEHWPALSREP